MARAQGRSWGRPADRRELDGGCGSLRGRYSPLIAAVGAWFEKRRALALGVALSGVGAGILAGAPICSFLLSVYGWRNAFVVLGLTRCFSAPSTRVLVPTGRSRISSTATVLVSSPIRSDTNGSSPPNTEDVSPGEISKRLAAMQP